eukprot:TRINITY_DN2628_c0_g1_i1.p1 TRINITY_DN2628_c0_g1~~TRINITY_DN2628_c0_g1_i1.p1  ORF type:complete len:240 (-),score=39.94 TRINITY_DN2628_c0_g1_i1:50-694(-)
MSLSSSLFFAFLITALVSVGYAECLTCSTGCPSPVTGESGATCESDGKWHLARGYGTADGDLPIECDFVIEGSFYSSVELSLKSCATVEIQGDMGATTGMSVDFEYGTVTPDSFVGPLVTYVTRTGFFNNLQYKNVKGLDDVDTAKFDFRAESFYIYFPCKPENCPSGYTPPSLGSAQPTHNPTTSPAGSQTSSAVWVSPGVPFVALMILFVCL